MKSHSSFFHQAGREILANKAKAAEARWKNTLQQVSFFAVFLL